MFKRDEPQQNRTFIAQEKPARKGFKAWIVDFTSSFSSAFLVAFLVGMCLFGAIGFMFELTSLMTLTLFLLAAALLVLLMALRR